MKICTQCSSVYPATLEYFYSCVTVKSGLRSKCKSCYIARSVRYERTRRSNNPEKYKSHRNKYLKDSGKGVEYSHRRRALYTGVVDTEQWQMIINVYGGACLYPGCANTNVTMDHVIALANGGPHTIYNLQPLCRSHNCKKRDQNIDYRPDSGKMLTILLAPELPNR